jgi:hypothetical protein
MQQDYISGGGKQTAPLLGRRGDPRCRCLGRDVQFAEAAVLKLEKRTKP